MLDAIQLLKSPATNVRFFISIYHSQEKHIFSYIFLQENLLNSKIYCNFAANFEKRNQKEIENKMIGEVINAKDYSLKPKATIQQTGKTGFNTDAIEQLKIDENKAVVLAPDTQEKHVLYMAVVDADANDRAFAVRKSGAYYYINTKQLYDHMEFDYAKNTIIFDLVRCNKYDEAIGGECYKMIARVRTRTAEENDE